MRAGTNGNGVAGDIESKLTANLANMRESLADQSQGEMREIEVNARVPGQFHLPDDRLAHLVARSKFELGRVLLHESHPVAVTEIRPFAPNSLGDQVPGTPGDVEHRRVELHEFHIAQRAPGAKRGGMSIGSGDRRIRRFAVDLPSPSRCEDCLLRPDQGLSMLAIPQDRSPTLTITGQ